VIVCEELRVRNRLKNQHLAKSLRDAGWSAFVSILTFKAAGAGKRVVAVEPASTSPRCSSWGRIVWKGLSVRWHECPYEDCGVRLDRDHNAARNILALGQAETKEEVGVGTVVGR